MATGLKTVLTKAMKVAIKPIIMEREIEFRAFVTVNCDEKEMVYNWCFLNPENNNFYGVDTTNERPDIGDVIAVMQLSPFKDTDGKKIYDGDIIGYWYDNDGKKELSAETVFFDEITGQWMLDQSSKQDRSYMTSLYAELNEYHYFVRGNIYENPELLNQ